MRRSAVILAYGNACIICSEDDYTKLTINGDVNYLYNTIIQKSGHRVICYNCDKKPYTNKYTIKYKQQLVLDNGGCCQECLEERIERLTITADGKLLCYNCNMSKIAAEKYAKDHPDD